MNQYTSLLARATPPEILFADDIASLLGVTTTEAEWEARTGRLGPAFFIHGRVAVLRQDLLGLLRVKAGAPDVADREVLP